jgi:hypothetical protein
LIVTGSVSTFTSLPYPGTFQDLYVTLDTGYFYYFGAGGWINVGYLGVTGPTGPVGSGGGGGGGSQGWQGWQGWQGVTGPAGGGGGGGGITTIFTNDGTTLTPSINQSIRVIAGDYYNGTGRPLHPSLIIPTPSAINDYLTVEYMTASNYIGGSVPGPTFLDITFPSCNVTTQNAFTTTNYVWTYGTGTSSSNWNATTYVGSNSYYT